MKTPGKGFVVLLGLLLGNAAHADCRVTTTAIDFGTYDVFAAVPRDSTGTVTVACDRNTPRPMRTNVIISIGPSPTSGRFNPRQMRRTPGTDRLDYNLYTSPSMFTVWGDGSAGTSTVILPRVGTRRPVVTTIHGRIPPRQNVYVGSYTETLTVTITP